MQTGVLDVKLLKPETEEYKKFEDEVRKKTAEPPFNYKIPENEEVIICLLVVLLIILLVNLRVHNEI